MRDLGITYDSNLKFDTYIANITSRAYQRIGLIFRGFVSRNTDLLTRAYITYVRPILEYCTCIWSPYLLGDIRKIENVQRYFTRRLFPGSKYSYSERLQLLNLENLECRRIKYDIKMYFKIIHGLIHINEQSNFLMLCPNIKETRGHGYRLQKRMFHNDRHFYSFTNRAVDCWNALPNEIIYAKSFDAFSRGVKALDLAEFLKGVP